MDLALLQMLNQMKLRKSERDVSVLVEKETKLRNELARLRDLERKTHAQTPADQELRLIGADVVWLKWLGRAQRSLNMELARVLAQKEAVRMRFQKDFGKAHVSQELLDQEKTDARKAKSKRALDQAIENDAMARQFNNPGGQSRG